MNKSKGSRRRSGMLWYNGKVCAYCGMEAEHKRDMTVDHIIARADGGTNLLSNLQLLCCPCNQRKNKIETLARNEMARVI